MKSQTYELVKSLKLSTPSTPLTKEKSQVPLGSTATSNSSVARQPNALVEYFLYVLNQSREDLLIERTGEIIWNDRVRDLLVEEAEASDEVDTVGRGDRDGFASARWVEGSRADCRRR